jgi:hypothetical protein
MNQRLLLVDVRALAKLPTEQIGLAVEQLLKIGKEAADAGSAVPNEAACLRQLLRLGVPVRKTWGAPSDDEVSYAARGEVAKLDDLIDRLQTLRRLVQNGGNAPVVQSCDPEGNAFSRTFQVSVDHYLAHDEFSGDLADSDTAGVEAIVLWPAS